MKQLVLLAICIAAFMLWPVPAVAQTEAQAVAQCTSAMAYAQLEFRGDDLRRLKDYEGAIRCYTEEQRKGPKTSGLENKIGISYLMQANYRKAESHFQTAVKLDKKNAEAINNIGVIAYINHNFGRATKYYKNALALDETNASVHANLGSAWFAQKKFDRAIAEYTRALELDPDVVLRASQNGVSARISSPEERAQYLYLLAKLYAKRGDADRCFECLRKAKEEGYRKMYEVYRDQEFAQLRQDPRLNEIVPPR